MMLYYMTSVYKIIKMTGVDVKLVTLTKRDSVIIDSKLVT